MDSVLVDIDSPEDFQNADLRSMDELLRCPICCEVMTTATLIVKCLHNFCSICIRRHIEQKEQCPICKEVCYENSLVVNKLVNQLATHYLNARTDLVSLDKQLTSSPTADSSRPATELHTPQKCTTPSKAPSPCASAQPSLTTLFKIKKRGSCDVKTVGVPSCYENSGSGTDAKGVVKNDQRIQLPASASSSSGECKCPVCDCSLLPHKINQHLDLCLKRQKREEGEMKGSPAKRKKLPCLVWNMMSEKNLKEQCKKYKLPTNGRKTDFIKRLKEYTLRYNSQIDHQQQKSGLALAREVTEVERVQSRGAVSVVGKIKTDADKQAYSEKYEDQFVKLINAARPSHAKPSGGNNRSRVATTDDEVTITHEVLSTPKKKCNGSLLGFFGSPSGHSSNGQRDRSSTCHVLPSPSSQNTTVGDSDDIQQYSSPFSAVKHPTCTSTPALPFSSRIQLPSSETAGDDESSRAHHHPSHLPSPVCIDVSPFGGTPDGKHDNTVVPRQDVSTTPRAVSRDKISPLVSRSDGSRTAAPKTLFASPPINCSNSGDDDLFGEEFDDLGDLDYNEIDLSLTQQPKIEPHQHPESTNTEIEGKSSSILARDLTRTPSPTIETKKKKKRVRDPGISKGGAGMILDHVLGEDHNAYLEQEVSRLYEYRNENVDSTNMTNITKVDRLLERSYKTSSNTTPRTGHDDSLAEMLQDLGRSPSLSGEAEVCNVTSPHGTTPRTLPALDLIESPPMIVPDIDEDSLPAQLNSSPELSLELSGNSPVIDTGLRLRKRKSGGFSPCSGTPPKRGRITRLQDGHGN